MVDINRTPTAPAWLERLGSRFCLLCGRRSSVVAVYIPGKNTPVAPAPGRQRRIVYSLCDRCVRRADVAEAAEARIESQFRAVGMTRDATA